MRVTNLTLLIVCCHPNYCIYIKHTNFGQVKVLKVVRSLSGAVGYRITFEAFSPPGVFSVFVAKVLQCYDEYRTIEIEPVKIKRSDSTHKRKKKSPEDLPPNIPQQQTLSEVCFLVPF